jgi:hypothetical protein
MKFVQRFQLLSSVSPKVLRSFHKNFFARGGAVHERAQRFTISPKHCRHSYLSIRYRSIPHHTNQGDAPKTGHRQTFSSRSAKYFVEVPASDDWGVMGQKLRIAFGIFLPR